MSTRCVCTEARRRPAVLLHAWWCWVVRIVVHDYAGHPFQVQLSRELARRGHDVLHLHCSSLRTGKGALAPAPGDPPTLSIDAIALDERFEKYAPRKRIAQEWQYGGRVSERVQAFRPTVVLSANTPLLSQRRLLTASRRSGARFIFWQQDMLGIGTRSMLDQRLRWVGRSIGAGFVALERSLVRASDAIVVVSSDFEPILRRWKVSPERIHVIENWAPLDELPLVPRENPWAREQGVVGKKVILYSGTLGLKHNPTLLLHLALHFGGDPETVVIVVSEGLGSDWLKKSVSEHKLENLTVLDFQPYERLPEVLGSADILVAILEPDAGVFSVPSKILSYHCAGRPLLAAVPAENLGARIIRDAESGIVVDPRSSDELGFAAEALLSDSSLREQLGTNARRYAELTFDIGRVADRFMDIFSGPHRAIN
jgi:colanic acid biosynthesis glycosyl transferase WcaI